MPDLFRPTLDDQIAALQAAIIRTRHLPQRAADRESAKLRAALDTLRQVRAGIVQPARTEECAMGDAKRPQRQGGTREQPMMIEQPLVLIFLEPGGSMITHLHPAEGFSHESYGLIVCDLVRHIAAAFDVDEADVWEWVGKERRHQTSDIKRLS